MAVSAFKSTSRRGTQTNPSPSFSSSSSRDQISKESVKKTPIRRSRSVSAVQRSQLSQDEFQLGSNTIDNPLFDCSSGSSKSSVNESERTGIGKGLRAKDRGRIWRDPLSVTQNSRERSLTRGNPVRQRVRSVSRGPSRSNESDYLSSDIEEGRIYESVRSKVQRAVSQIRDDLQNVIKGKGVREISHDNITTEYTAKLEQSQERIRKLRAELAFEEQKKEELNKILNEVNLSFSAESSQGQKIKPKKRTSIERREVSRRLEEEAMNYFEECVSISNFDGSDLSSIDDQILIQKSGIGIPNPLIGTQKTGIEHPDSLIGTRESGIGIPNSLIEESGIGIPNSLIGESRIGISNPLLGNQESQIGIFLSNEEIAFAESLISNDEPSFLEDSDNNQTPRSVRTIGSDLALSYSSNNYRNSPNLKPNYYNDTYDYKSKERFHFSFTDKNLGKDKNTQNYLENFGKGILEEKIVKSRYIKDEYILKGESEKLINERVVLRNRLQSGGILICDIRIF